MGRGRRFAVLLAVMAVALAVLPPAARAHALRPAIVTLAVSPDGAWSATLQLNLEAALAGIGPEHADTSAAPQAAVYDGMRQWPPARLRAAFDAAAPRLLEGVEVRFDGQPAPARLAAVDIPPVGDLRVERLSTLRLEGTVPAGSRTVTWRYDPALGDSAVRFAGADGRVMHAEWLGPGQPSAPWRMDAAPVPPEPLARRVVTYIGLGFTHILPAGLDHVLFVLGICLLPVGWRALLVQVTAFTVAHSLTLALGLYGVVTLPATIVEPLIALSIVWIAIENLWVAMLRWWRPLVVFGFGLLHGLGFAGVLRELALPGADFVVALVSFNVGVELGQLAVVVAVLLLAGPRVRRRPWYRTRVLTPASVAIAAVGAFWTVTRLLPPP